MLCLDSKAKKFNQRYRKAALREIEAICNHEITRIAGLIPVNNKFSTDEGSETEKKSTAKGTNSSSILDASCEELKQPDEEFTK